MPSRIGRRVTYLLGSFMLFSLVVGALLMSGELSPACFDNDRCAAGETLLIDGTSLGRLHQRCIIQRWRGRLFGCRSAAG